ncbi:MAG: hypothetical protein AAB907_02200 [Patescibacteria group bacterium]
MAETKGIPPMFQRTESRTPVRVKTDRAATHINSAGAAIGLADILDSNSPMVKDLEDKAAEHEAAAQTIINDVSRSKPNRPLGRKPGDPIPPEEGL